MSVVPSIRRVTAAERLSRRRQVNQGLCEELGCNSPALYVTASRLCPQGRFVCYRRARTFAKRHGLGLPR